MNQNTNNQQNSNEVSKEKIDLQQLVAEILLHKTMLSGTKIREVSELISQSVELSHKSINEPITDQEIDAEIERYIKQFWPRPEHGGAVGLGFKIAVRWMQERQSNKPINFEDDIDTVGNCANCGVEFHIHKEKAKNEFIKDDSNIKSLNKIDNWLNALIYEEGGKMNAGSLRTIELIRKEVENILRHESLSKVQVDYYEDKIEMLQRLLAERDKAISELNEPVTDDEALKEKFWVMISESNRENDLGTAGKCVRICKQYAASKLNNSAGVWIKVSERLPENENDYFIINNGYKSVASFIKDDGFYRMGERQNKVSKWLDENVPLNS